MQNIREALQKEAVILDLKARDLQQVVHQAVNFLVARKWLAAENREQVEQAVWTRERQSTTAIGHSVALPHAYLDVLTRPTILSRETEKSS